MRRYKIMTVVLPIAVLAVCIFVGCMPYASNFSCPKSKDGRCGTLTDAYEFSRHPPDGTDQKSGEGSSANSAYTAYRDALNMKLAGLVKNPSTPMVKPPTVMRVLLLPYVGEDNVLFNMRFAYIMINDFSWTLGEYLQEAPSAMTDSDKIIRP